MTPKQLETYRVHAEETDADDGDAMLSLIREIKRLRTFIEGVREFDPRSDIYATDLMDQCNDVLGFCRCCGQEKCYDA